VAYGLSAYLVWGLVPIYFKAVAHIAPLEVVAHRVVWSVVLLVALNLVLGRGRAAVRAVAKRRTLLTLLGTTGLIAVNWYLFIWAVGHNLVLQASLGYFINPLVNVMLGFVFLGERLRPLQRVSVALAGLVVVALAVAGGAFPWIALTLAFSFGFYGLLRKTAPVDGLTGLTTETLLLLPAALAYIAYAGRTGVAAFSWDGWPDNALLIFSGVVTAIPLLLFTAGARRLRYATMGFMQYVAPTGHFLLAVFLYREPFDSIRALTFGMIWVALILYTVDTVRASRQSVRIAGRDWGAPPREVQAKPYRRGAEDEESQKDRQTADA